MDPTQTYRTRLAHFEALKQAATRTFRLMGNLRLWLGLLAVGVAFIAFGPGWISPWWLALIAAVFLAIAIFHEQVDQRVNAANRGVAYYERVLKRLDGQWAGTGNSGERFRASSHLFADDLDLFGRASVFERISIARTSAGERALADWFLEPGDQAEVVARQEAVAELRSRNDLREAMALMGSEVQAAADDKAPALWGAMPHIRFFPGARIVAFLLALAATVTFILFLFQVLSLRPLLVVFLLQIMYGFLVRDPVRMVRGTVSTPAYDLKLLSFLVERIEQEAFVSAGLVRLKKKLETAGRPASEQLRSLERLVIQLDAVRNAFFGIMVLPLLWAPQSAMAIEAWRQRCGPHIGDWVSALGEFEALCSLSSFAFERPEAVFPELLPGPEPRFEAIALLHPLIAVKEAVANDVALGPENRLWIISGSNMSGKSTLLRAVGVNAVLAWAGSPVTAANMRVSRLHLGASLRTVDSLEDHRSRFYAEISRLRDVMNLARSGRPLLFLFDEVLSGTNSHDRRIGAQAVLTKLVELGAIGMVTTHDLALAEIAPALDGMVRNVHFQDYLEGGEVRFDYHLRSGVVTRSNALDLMRAVGLEV